MSAGGNPFVDNFHQRLASDGNSTTPAGGRRLMTREEAPEAVTLAAGQLLGAESTSRMVLAIPSYVPAIAVVGGVLAMVAATVALLLTSSRGDGGARSGYLPL